MDREQMLGPADGAAQQGESFIEEHDRRWGKFGVVLIGLVGVVAIRFVWPLISTPSPEEIVIRSAAELQSQLPKQVDEVTTMTGVRGNGRRITYLMAISTDIPSGQLLAAKAQAEEDQRRDLCGDGPTRDAIGQGVSIAYLYTDRSGDRVETVTSSCAG